MPEQDDQQEDPSWKDGRLVLMRPEIPDSEVARINVPLTRTRRRILTEIVFDLIAERRREDENRIVAEFQKEYPTRDP